MKHRNNNNINNSASSRQFAKQRKWITLILSSALLLLGLYFTMKIGVPARFASTPAMLAGQLSGEEPLTIHCNSGRLGNQMCTLATLYGLSRLNGRKMLIRSCNFKTLGKFFDFELPLLDEKNFVERFPWNIRPYFEEKDKNIDVKSNIIKGYPYPCSFTFFDHVRDEIRALFRFKEDIQNHADEALSKSRGNRTNVTFVGVHVRRTDYLGKEAGHWLHAFGGKSFDVVYFRKAVVYYRKKYGGNVLFVAVSDDRQWCRENLVQLGIHVTDDAPSPAHDMALLTKCNHTIMTYGTFGFWGGYLAGGEVTYFDKFLPPDTDFTKNEFIFEKMYLPGWIGIETQSGHSE